MATIVLAMILSTGITTRSPVHNLKYLYFHSSAQISFADKTELTRLCAVGQYGIYLKNEMAYQILGCGTDTIFRTGHEVGETNKPQ